MNVKQAGKIGAGVRWAERYEIIKELSKYYNKKELNWFQEKWNTKQLTILLKSKLHSLGKAYPQANDK